MRDTYFVMGIFGNTKWAVYRYVFPMRVDVVAEYPTEYMARIAALELNKQITERDKNEILGSL